MGTQLRAGVVSLAACSAAPLKQNSLAILLSEEASAASWRLRVRARTGTASAELVTLLTTPVTGDLPPSRVIAIVAMPGVEEWAVEAELASGPADARAMLNLSSEECCGSWGIFPIAAQVETAVVVVPAGFVLERVVHLAPQALPAAGAFTAQAFSVVPIGTKRVTFWVTYTRGAVGGFPAFRAQWSNGTELASEAVEDLSSLAIVQPFGTTQVYEQELLGPTPADASALVYPIVFEVPDASIGVRLLAAERGVPATPGTIAIALTGSG